jgi:glycosyltransferase involved in cell wall biosynthesis
MLTGRVPSEREMATRARGTSTESTTRNAGESARRAPDSGPARLTVAHVTAADMTLRYLLLNQMCCIRQAGYEVTGISGSGPDVPVIEGAGVRHIAVPLTRRFSPWTDLVALWRLYRVLRRERFTIIHTHTPKGGLIGQYAALLARVPIRVHTIHGLYFPGHMNPKHRWLYVLLERLQMRFSHLNLSQNPEDIPVAVAEKMSAPDRIRLLGNGIDVVRFDPATQSAERRAATRAALGMSAGHKVVGMVARFVAEKGYREMLRAAQILREKVPEARFIFVGPVDSAKDDVLDAHLVDEMGVSDVVQFLGLRTDLPDLYAIMDVLVLPSYREGFPRAPMEAAAMGVPAVVTNVRGCRQTVDHGVTGLVIPPRDAGALAAALLELLTDDEKRHRLGRAARDKALAEFDERRVFARVTEAYGELVASRARSARRG